MKNEIKKGAAELAGMKRAAVYCREAEPYGPFEPTYPHNTIAYQTGNAMTFIIDKKMDYCGLYVDEANSTAALDALSKDCINGKYDAVIVRDLDVLGDDDDLLLWLEESFPVPFIGVEDLDSTKGTFDIETLEYIQEERHHSEEHKQAIRKAVTEQASEKQNEGIFTGRIPYGYRKIGDDLVADQAQAPTVRKIFELAADGNKLNDIRRYLRSTGIKSPTGGDWNLPGIKRILQRETYCGNDHVEALTSRDQFDQVQGIFTQKENQKRDDSEPDYFPMAVCDVCGKKLIFKRSRDLYLCDRHTGEFPTEKRLDHVPMISAQNLKENVIQEYNKHLADMKYFQDKPAWETDLCIDERGADKIALGEKLLELDPAAEDYLAKAYAVGLEYEGLWLDWIQALKNLKNDFYHTLFRQYLPRTWKPMREFDPRTVEKSVKSIRLKEDGSLEIHFKAEEAY